MNLIQKRKVVLDAWKQVAPDAVFLEMTREQFAEATQEPVEVRQRQDELKAERRALRQRRLEADSDLRDKLAELVNAVKGDKAHGEDSALYSAFGYVSKSARKSGLIRRGEAPSTTEGADAA